MSSREEGPSAQVHSAAPVAYMYGYDSLPLMSAPTFLPPHAPPHMLYAQHFGPMHVFHHMLGLNRERQMQTKPVEAFLALKNKEALGNRGQGKVKAENSGNGGMQVERHLSKNSAAGGKSSAGGGSEVGGPTFMATDEEGAVVQVGDPATFYKELHAFHEGQGKPIQKLPTLGFKELDLFVLYYEVARRGGIARVISGKKWKEIAEKLELPPSCTDAGFRLRLHYKKYLEDFASSRQSPPVCSADESGEPQEIIAGEESEASVSTNPRDGSLSSSNPSSPSKSPRAASGRVQKKRRRHGEPMDLSPSLRQEEKLLVCERAEMIDDGISSGMGSPVTCVSDGVPLKLTQRMKVDRCRVDLSLLGRESLLRYCKAYDGIAESSKPISRLSNSDLVGLVEDHFRENIVDVDTTLDTFISSVRRNR